MEQHFFSETSPWLAPLAGYSDISLRLLCRARGARVACTEMVSAKGLHYESKGTQNLLQTEKEDSPLVVQLFGESPTILSYAMEDLQKAGYTHFDLNLGCSVPKVCKTGSGVALMRDSTTLEKIARAICSSAKKGHVGFKIRLGWNEREENYLEVATLLEQCGAGWISLHPRYAKQGYSGIANWEKTKTLVTTVTIPVIASGDFFTAEDAVRCVRQTGANTVMFARGALSNPHIFEEYTALIQNIPYTKIDLMTMYKTIYEHISYIKKYSPERQALVRMRSIIPKYIKGYGDIKSLHQQLILSKQWKDVYTALDTFMEHHFSSQATI
ncbi:MAG: tRNA dihydrouridine synthase [Desulfovibrionaceae bacterium]